MYLIKRHINTLFYSNLERLRIIDFDQEREGEIHDIEITEGR